MIIEVRRGGRVQRITYEDFEARIRDGDIREDTLVRFALVTGEAFRPAGELEPFSALADPESASFRRNLTAAGLPLATAILVGLQLRIYLLSWGPGATTWMQTRLTNWNPAVLEQGEVWRILTYGLLHVDGTHLLFNLLFIAYAGYHLERGMGWRNLLILFFGSVVSGGLMSLIFSPNMPTLGSSGGGFGLLAAAVIFGWKHWESIPQTARKYFGFAILPYPAISIVTNIGAKNVDNWCHLGGLLGGALLMTAVEPEVFSIYKARNRVVRTLTVALMAGLMAVLWAAGPRLVTLQTEEETGAVFVRPEGWRRGGAFTGESGWFSPTGATSLVAVDDVATAPVTLEQLERAFLDRLSSGARDVVVRERRELPLQHAKGVWLTLDLVFDELPQQVDAILIARGVYSYRVQVMCHADLRERLDPLVQRLLKGVMLTELPEVADARLAVEQNPRSWGPHLRLASALARAGEVDEALASLATAGALAPGEPEVSAARITLLAEQRPAEAVTAAREALTLMPGEPKIIVAAAGALKAGGQEAEAVKLLDDSWAALPGDRTLKKARRAWGLPVTLPAPKP